MVFVGIAVRTENKRARLRGIVLDGSDVKTFDYPATDTNDIAVKVATIADGLDGSLSAFDDIQRIVVRQGDDGQRAGLTAAVVQRLRTEGAAIYVARQRCSDVRVLSGPQIGRACGGNLADAETAAVDIAAPTWKVAASAALAAQSLED